MKSKNIVSLLLCGCMVSSVLLTPVQGAQVNKKQIDLSTSIELSDLDTVEYTDKENVYKYGTADNYLQWSDFAGVSDNYNEGIMILSDPGSGSDAKIIVKPIYRTYQNKTVKAAAEVMTAYIVSKLPGKITKNPLLNWFVTKMTKLTDGIKPTYVGSWVWESQGSRYVTLVHYKDDSYSEPIDVQIIDITNW